MKKLRDQENTVYKVIKRYQLPMKQQQLFCLLDLKQLISKKLIGIIVM